MAALISILLKMPKFDAMSSSGFPIGITWATRICKEKNFISRIQVQPHGTRIISLKLMEPGRSNLTCRYSYKQELRPCAEFFSLGVAEVGNESS